MAAEAEVRLDRINIKLLKHPQKRFSLWCPVVCIPVPGECKVPIERKNSLQFGNSCKCSLSLRENLFI